MNLYLYSVYLFGNYRPKALLEHAFANEITENVLVHPNAVNELALCFLDIVLILPRLALSDGCSDKSEDKIDAIVDFFGRYGNPVLGCQLKRELIFLQSQEGLEQRVPDLERDAEVFTHPLIESNEIYDVATRVFGIGDPERQFTRRKNENLKICVDGDHQETDEHNCCSDDERPGLELQLALFLNHLPPTYRAARGDTATAGNVINARDVGRSLWVLGLVRLGVFVFRTIFLTVFWGHFRHSVMAKAGPLPGQ
jgi:hypothetical protein